jgi:serine/threonine protein phosphatase PrpC
MARADAAAALHLHRSLGDFAWKHPQPLLSAEPYVATHALAPQDKLVLLTSDGVSDVLPDSDLLGIGLRAIEEVRARCCWGVWGWPRVAAG